MVQFQMLPLGLSYCDRSDSADESHHSWDGSQGCDMRVSPTSKSPLYIWGLGEWQPVGPGRLDLRTPVSLTLTRGIKRVQVLGYLLISDLVPNSHQNVPVFYHPSKYSRSLWRRTGETIIVHSCHSIVGPSPWEPGQLSVTGFCFWTLVQTWKPGKGLWPFFGWPSSSFSCLLILILFRLYMWNSTFFPPRKTLFYSQFLKFSSGQIPWLPLWLWCYEPLASAVALESIASVSYQPQGCQWAKFQPLLPSVMSYGIY